MLLLLYVSYCYLYRGHLYEFHSRLLFRSKLFTQRVINNWNSLIISSNTVGQFKNKLDKDWELSGYGFEQALMHSNTIYQNTLFLNNCISIKIMLILIHAGD